MTEEDLKRSKKRGKKSHDRLEIFNTFILLLLVVSAVASLRKTYWYLLSFSYTVF